MANTTDDPMVLQPLKGVPEHANGHSTDLEEPDSSPEVKEQIIEAIGPWGRWHWHKLTFVCCIIWIPASIHLLNMVFYRADVDHWCRPPDGLKNVISSEDWRNLSAPLDENGKRDQCRVYEFDFQLLYDRYDGDLDVMKGKKIGFLMRIE